MSLRIRGQEAQLRISIEGQAGVGTWLKVSDWTVTPRTDLVEKDYAGEDETDLDIQHHGFDISFSCDVQDAQAFNFLSTLVSNESDHVAPQRVVITVLYAPRETGVDAFGEVYQGVFLKLDETANKGRKEYLSQKFTGKCKKRAQLAA